MLLGRSDKPTTFAIFDICTHAYVLPAFDYMKERFPHVDFELHPGDSTKALTGWIARNPSVLGTYDLAHVDGGHSLHCITHDMANATKLIKSNGLIVIDDTEMKRINDIVDKYLASGVFSEVTNIMPTTRHRHRIIKKTALE